MLGGKKKETVTFRDGWLEGDSSASVSLCLHLLKCHLLK